MNPAPLPFPAPFTCSNCGVGLQSKSGLCPRCGARLDETKHSPLSAWAIIGLTLGLLVFGAVITGKRREHSAHDRLEAVLMLREWLRGKAAPGAIQRLLP